MTGYDRLYEKMERAILFLVRYAYAVASCLYLFTVGFLFAKNRRLIGDICDHFDYPKKPDVIIPQVKLSEIVSENVPVQIYEPAETAGGISLLELFVIIQLVRSRNPLHLFEIGTFDGRSTINMAKNSPVGSKIYTLDLPKEKIDATKLKIQFGDRIFIDKEISGSTYLNKDSEGKITQLYGDSATFDFSSFYGTMDFIFIDGAHSYEYVVNDTNKALKLLRNRKGIIIWHDYDHGWPGVTTALNELFKKGELFADLKHIEGTSMICLLLNNS